MDVESASLAFVSVGSGPYMECTFFSLFPSQNISFASCSWYVDIKRLRWRGLGPKQNVPYPLCSPAQNPLFQTCLQFSLICTLSIVSHFCNDQCPKIVFQLRKLEKGIPSMNMGGGHKSHLQNTSETDHMMNVGGP